MINKRIFKILPAGLLAITVCLLFVGLDDTAPPSAVPLKPASKPGIQSTDNAVERDSNETENSVVIPVNDSVQPVNIEISGSVSVDAQRNIADDLTTPVKMAAATRSMSNNETGNLIVATNGQPARGKTWSMSSSNYGSTSVARVNAPAKSNSLPYRSPSVNGGGGGYGGTPAATRPVGGDQRLIDKPVLPTSPADSHSRLQNFAPTPKTFSDNEFNKKIVTSSADQGWLDTFGDTGFASTNNPGDAIDNINQVISNNNSFSASGGSKQNIAPVTANKSLLNAGVSSEKSGNRQQPNISIPKLPGNTGKNLSVAESDPQNFFGPIPNSIYPDINQHAPTNQLTRYHPSGTVNPDHSKPANFAPVISFKPDSIHYVSEPSVLAIFGLGLAGLGIIFRRAV